MHRHGYKGRKLGRERDQRNALLKSLSEALIEHESIETTFAKAKELVPFVEKLITKAKVGTLHSRRIVLSRLHTTANAHKLVDELVPRLQSRSSGHLRVERTVTRRGDNAQLARVSFIFDKEQTPTSKPTKDDKTTAASKKTTDTTKKDAPVKAKKPATKKSDTTKDKKS